MKSSRTVFILGVKVHEALLLCRVDNLHLNISSRKLSSNSGHDRKVVLSTYCTR